MHKSFGSARLGSMSLVVSLIAMWPLGCGSNKSTLDTTASGSGGISGSLGTGGTLPSDGSWGTGGGVSVGGGVVDAGAAPGLGKGGDAGRTTVNAGSPGAGGMIVAGAGGRQGAGGVSATGGRGGGSGTGTVSIGTGGKPGSGGTSGSSGIIDAGTIDVGSVLIPLGAPGNPEGKCAIPAEAAPEDVSKPTTVIGKGTPESCTGADFVAAVAKGGIITFDCGPNPATIALSQPAKVWNDKGPKIVIDGGGKITLDGRGVTRILYMNTCDEKQVWTSEHCDNQETPQLTVQNLTFANGNAKNESEGGGAIFASGGRLKIINSRFVGNVCADTGPDIGGGAVRAFQQYQGLPVYVVNSTFGGADGLGNIGSNGGALSSIGVSWTVLNSIHQLQPRHRQRWKSISSGNARWW